MELEELNDTPQDTKPQPTKQQTKPEIGPDGIPLEVQGSDDEQAHHPEEEEGSQQDNPLDENGVPKDYKPSKFDEPGRVRRFATILNLLNSLLGAGILGVPGAMKHCGVIISVLMIILVAIISHISACLSLKLQVRVSANGLDDIALKITGKIGQTILSILNILFMLSTMVAYVIIGGDSLLSWLSLAGLDWNTGVKRAVIVGIYALVFPVLLSIPRDLKFLSYLSFVTFVAIIFYDIVTVIKAIQIIPNTGVASDVILAKFDVGIFQSISIFGLSFALPIVIFPIFSQYNKDTYKREFAVGVAVVLTFILVTLSGVLGYLIKGNAAGSNFLLIWPNDDVLILICRIGFFLVVSFSYPCVARTAFCSLSQMIYKENDANLLVGMKRFIVLLIGNAIPVLISLVLPNAGPALSIGGALGGGVVDFFYPALMWVIISKKKWYHWQNILCILMCIFGILTAVVSVYYAVLDAIASF